MLECTCELHGLSPLCFSKKIHSEINTGEGYDVFEERTWRERLHIDQNGNAFIPPSALKKCLANVAGYLSEKVPGKGMATYTKNFTAGIMVTEALVLHNGSGPIKADSVEGNRLFVPSRPSSGKKGGSSVWKTFPTIPVWHCAATVTVLDPLLVDRPELVERYLGHAGKFIGLLAMRPQNGGYFGRFAVKDFKSTQVE